jgi:hypothetical protein
VVVGEAKKREEKRLKKRNNETNLLKLLEYVRRAGFPFSSR